MTKKLILGLALMSMVLSLPLAASAVTLSNTGISETTFLGFAGSPILGTTVMQPYSFGAGTSGWVDSAVWTGGIVNNNTYISTYVYTYRIRVTAGSIAGMSVLGFGDTLVDAPGLPGVSSFWLNTTGSFASPLFGDSNALNDPDPTPFGGTNGTIAPITGELDNTTGVFRNFFFSFAGFGDGNIDAGESSRIFGAVSVAPPGIVLASLLDGGGATVSPLVVAPVPEPGTLLLLGSGLSGLAAWGWRRRKPVQ